MVLGCINLSMQLILTTVIMYLDQLAGNVILYKNISDYTIPINEILKYVPFIISIYMLFDKETLDKVIRLKNTSGRTN